MEVLRAIIGYAGPLPFLVAAAAAGLFVIAMSWLGGSQATFRFIPLMRGWVLVSALMAMLIVLGSSVLLQRSEGLFAVGGAAGAAGVMGLLTAALFPLIAAEQGKLDRVAMTFGLTGGLTAGFSVWFAMFALFPRVESLFW